MILADKLYMRLVDMKPSCATHAKGNTPQRTICQEMVRRFQVTDSDIKDHGGILNTATYYADKEYVNALSNTPWIAPRASPTSFIKFLDRKGFVIPWYIEKTSHVNRLNAAARQAQSDCVTQSELQCQGETRNSTMAQAMAGAILMGKYGGWNVRGQLTLNSERSPDAVLDERTARCSEWLTSLKGASLFVGGDVRTQVIPGNQYHLEVYWALDAPAEKLWNLTLYEGENATSQAVIVNSNTTSALMSPADTVVAISINRILSSNAEPKIKHQRLMKLQNWGGSDPIRTWLRSAIDVYAGKVF